ncbi:MAG TPA: peptide deformylase [Alphaproteobacteria bacterium]|nr:peptide deformylase [Alphaproteobacteria bacterium]
MSGFASQAYEGIVTCDNDPTNVLRQPTCPILIKEWDVTKATIQKLLNIRENILRGGAGLAAPQIGINHPIFIYTPDRTTESLRIVINPSFEPVGEEMVEGYEACFSEPLRCAKIKRWKKIKVTYQNQSGEVVEDVLDGFAAKVFQHEMDHLKGKLIIDHKNAEVLTFTNPQVFQDHMKQIHLEDSKRYPNKA